MNIKYSNLAHKFLEKESNTWRRTSSGRTVKRKRFDDEIIESGFKKDRQKIPVANIGPESILPPEESTISHSIPTQAVVSQSVSDHETIPQNISETPTLNLWTPEDHLKLIYAVQQTCDLEAVHHCTKFSYKFTVEELKLRWRSLLYDPDLSKQYVAQFAGIHPGVVRRIQNQCPPNKHELEALRRIPFDSNPDLEVFSKLLESNKAIFKLFRLPRRLAELWHELKEFEEDSALTDFYELLASSEVNDCEDEDGDDSDDAERLKEEISSELLVAEGVEKEEIVRLERQVQAWDQALTSLLSEQQEKIEFDEQTYALLKCQGAVYKMKSPEFTVGKRPQKKPQSNNTQQQSNNMNEQPVDVDLSSHAMSHKISRRHFSIHLHHRTSSKEAKDKDTEQDNNYIEFVLSNHSRRPVSVDHKEVPQQCTLTDNSSIQISNFLHMSFHVHKELLKTLTHPVSSSTTISSSSSSSTILSS